MSNEPAIVIPSSYNAARLRIYGLPPAEVILEYLVESQHNNWDGHGRGIPAIKRMIEDMNLYATAECGVCQRPRDKHVEADFDKDGMCKGKV